MATGAVGAAGLLAACGSKPAASSTASSAASRTRCFRRRELTSV
ncbi:MAG: hypothetical protein ACLVJH_12790 [Faecalibacterium prausnitzii]